MGVRLVRAGPVTPQHALILPIAHLPVSTQFSESMLTEVSRFKTALRQTLALVDQTCVFFERHVPTKGVSHMHLQCLPVPNANIAAIGPAFAAAATKIGIDLREIPPAQGGSQKQIVGSSEYFMWIELPDESIMWSPIDAQSRAATKVIQFGRFVV